MICGIQIRIFALLFGLFGLAVVVYSVQSVQNMGLSLVPRLLVYQSHPQFPFGTWTRDSVSGERHVTVPKCGQGGGGEASEPDSWFTHLFFFPCLLPCPFSVIRLGYGVCVL
ncbi:hypothetical protein QBC41DRAFT_328882 [Cercophora samala]|uniref:Uncharacterized protein n=1 Tax=Cercophora samala TaxID=330535 RepID=A0AA40D6Z2_9PEZI|nr:hypothetical protein QBC41DRAFT_328882 [Cercophora samala]